MDIENINFDNIENMSFEEIHSLLCNLNSSDYHKAVEILINIGVLEKGDKFFLAYYNK